MQEEFLLTYYYQHLPDEDSSKMEDRTTKKSGRQDEDQHQDSTTSDNQQLLDCVCGVTKNSSTLKCTDCTRRVHWGCTELPVYQLCIFIKTHRRYTCPLCASAYIDEKTDEDIQAALTDARQPTDDKSSPPETAIDNKTIENQLQANHQATTTDSH